jgi:hypothetical protein
MKRSLYVLLILTIVSTAVFAQEVQEEQQQTQPDWQAGQMPGGEVSVGMGTLKFNGMILAGFRAGGMNQEGWDKDGNWSIEGYNPLFAENRADLYLGYSFMNYGAFLGLRAQNYGANSYDYDNNIMPRYVFAYANFGPTKLSMGKLYDELIPVQGSRLWKTSGPGDSHRFTDEEAYSMRLEVKPPSIEGLNVGLQWFFPAFDGYIEGFRLDDTNAISGHYGKGLDETEAWKELGIAAQYSNSLFDAQLGVRFDSAVDRYNKLDTGPPG